jgi:uncharacterized protein (DUF2062 family)
MLLEIEYAIGSKLLGFFDGVAHPASVTDFHIHELMKWTTFFTIGLPMLLGSMFLSAPAAAVSYAVMLPVFKRRERRRLERQQGEGI